ncbi:MAG: exopolysaccharide biosynthesis polyprenyl glycosylphosphotransferase [bacterium]
MKNWRKTLLFLGDALMLCGAGYLMLIIRFGINDAPQMVQPHLVPFSIWGGLIFVIFYIFNVYEATSLKPNFTNLRQFLLALGTSTLAGITLFYFLSFQIAPKTNLLITQALFAGLVFLWRSLFYYVFAKNFKNNIAFIGETPESKILIENIKQNPHIGYAYKGTFTDFDALLQSSEKIDTIVYIQTIHTADLMQLSQSSYQYLDIKKAFQMILSKLPVSLIDDGLAIKILEQRENILEKTIRRLIDIVFASSVILITLPITIITAIAIFINDRKQIFLKQTRVGKQKNLFTIYKFRSMIVLSADGSAENTGAQWASQNDNRITKVGKIIRKTHIDEIPQMINILRGDITLVGPRPERPEFVEGLEKEIPYYFLRHTVKPGFTGWAQIKFRYARSIMDSREKFEYDLFYIKNHTLFIDLGIIIKTIQIIFTH